QQCLLSEIVGGLIRGIKYWSKEDQDPAKALVLRILARVLSTAELETVLRILARVLATAELETVLRILARLLATAQLKTVLRILARVLATAELETVGAWAASLRFAVFDRHPARVAWLTTYLFDNALPITPETAANSVIMSR
ncbi:hypothetical protein T484DRAFT_1811384, partial [Baffinella frigidus]